MPLSDGDRIRILLIVTGFYVDTSEGDGAGHRRFRERHFGIGRAGVLGRHLSSGALA